MVHAVGGREVSLPCLPDWRDGQERNLLRHIKCVKHWGPQRLLAIVDGESGGSNRLLH